MAKKNEKEAIDQKNFFHELSLSKSFNHEILIDQVESIKLSESQLKNHLKDNNIEKIKDYNLQNYKIEENEEIENSEDVERIDDFGNEEENEEDNSNCYSEINDKVLISSTFEQNIGSKIKNRNIKILEEIGSGGQATVYLGLNEENKEKVAVKFYNIVKEESLTRVKRQLDFLDNLHHKNIVNYLHYDIQKQDNNPLTNITIIIEYCDTNLENYVNQYKKENKLKYLPLKMVSDITKQILNGLFFLHKKRIIHRDIKPKTILLNYKDKIMKICDFGISVLVKYNENTIMKRSMVGDFHYMSPQVLMGKEVGFDCDIWSLGCVVYFLVSGLHPYISNDKNNFNYINIINYSNPLEVADDDILDIFYHRDNRILLDFVHRCWRGNNIFRPTAEELLKHPFVNGYYDNK